MRRQVLLILASVLLVGGGAYAALASATTLPVAGGTIWQRSESAHFEIFAPRGLGAPAAFADSLERALADVRREFPASGRGPRIVLALSRAHAATLNGGYSVAGMYVPDSHTVVIVRPVLNPVLLRHELAHAEVRTLWGPPHPSATWLDEGIANLVGSRCGAMMPKSVARLHLETGRLPRLARILEDFRAIPEVEGYPAAGSLVEFLLARDGRAALEPLWRGAAPDFAEQEWHGFLQRAPRVFSAPRSDCSVRGA